MGLISHNLPVQSATLLAPIVALLQQLLFMPFTTRWLKSNSIFTVEPCGNRLQGIFLTTIHRSYWVWDLLMIGVNAWYKLPISEPSGQGTHRSNHFQFMSHQSSMPSLKYFRNIYSTIEVQPFQFPQQISLMGAEVLFNCNFFQLEHWNENMKRHSENSRPYSTF